MKRLECVQRCMKTEGVEGRYGMGRRGGGGGGAWARGGMTLGKKSVLMWSACLVVRAVIFYFLI